MNRIAQVRCCLSITAVFWSGSVNAVCSCADNCINHDYDLVARITVLEEDKTLRGTYRGAYQARLDKLVVQGDVLVKNPEDYAVADKLANGDSITIVADGILMAEEPKSPKQKLESPSACARNYKEGDQMLYFATKVEPMVYVSDLCTCTVHLKKTVSD